MKYTIPLWAIVLLLGANVFFGHPATTKSFGTTNIPLNVPLTQGAVLCGNNTSTLLVATSTSGRNFMTISNDSPVTVFIGFGYSASINKGLMLNASTTYTLNANNTYTGAIYCTGLGAAASTTYSDSNS